MLQNKLVLVGLLAVFTLSAQIKPFDKNLIPQPVFENTPELVDLYWKAWELSYSHIKEQEGVPQSPYMDEAFWDNTIWIWDTEFMVMFCKYAPQLFPGIESLDNFYRSILDKEPSVLKIQHPDNPPFYALVESDYFKFTDDTAHLVQLINENKYLQRYYEWFEILKPGTRMHFEHAYISLDNKGIGYKWDGIQSGMDNTPRGREQRKNIFWIDAISQQALSALYISRLAAFMGDAEVARRFEKEYNDKKSIINTYYWDEEDGFYYDILEADTSFVKVRTPASYWTMLAEVPNQTQAESMLKYAVDSLEFGGAYPWPTVSRKDPDFNAEYGDYWRGGIWVPTAYMATKALEKYGFYEVADKNATQLLMRMLETYQKYEPATIWECYNPTKPEPVQRVYGDKLEVVRPDFCGWSALAPISMLIENVLGFHSVNAQTKTVEWRKYQRGTHGIKNLRFGNIVTDIIAYEKHIEVKSNMPYTLKINGKDYEVKAGSQKITE